MKRLSIVAVGLALAVALAITSCTHEPTPSSPTATPAPTSAPPTATPAPTSARAVWDYCRRIGMSPGNAMEEGKPEVAGDWWLRCYQGKPLICECGATCGACLQLVYNEEEPPQLADWCRQHPNEFPPNYIAPMHAARVYSWECSNGHVVRKQNVQDLSGYDALGFPLGSWMEIPEPQDKEEPVPPPPPNSTFAQPPPTGGVCDPSYPDICIPRNPEYDCAHIPFRNVRVLLPDSHGLDPDGDGIGCEWP